MGHVNEFAAELARRTKNSFASWHKVDLHNHSPSSFDYEGDPATAADESAKAINSAGLSVVMFTDHGKLPDKSFIKRVSDQTRALILRGIELNIFADAFGKSDSKIHREAFFHLLVGFDPDSPYSADYWVDAVYQQCGREERTYGSHRVVGVKGGINQTLDVLKGSNALVIPAHLHTDSDAFRSRSIDDIYDDRLFLSFVPRFTALEVVSQRTAAFFDGQHPDTLDLEIACVRSSDAHRPGRLGSRPTWLRMQDVTFKELRASLAFRSRVSLEPPAEPSSYIVGAHIDGQYLRDLWLALSPHCNVFIGVKGSGKTAALECLRFALGVEVPRSSIDQVKAHLVHILGPSGGVRCLLRRTDGSLVLIQRTMTNPERFELTFEDDRVEPLTQTQALGFPAQILGWHEIEHAATDPTVRRKYLDAIAGQEDIAQIEAEAVKIAEQIKYDHEQAASRYQTFRTLYEQVKAKQELRRGLQQLRDASLIELQDRYEAAISHRDQLKASSGALVVAKRELPAKLTSLLPFAKPILPGTSPIEPQVAGARAALEGVVDEVHRFGAALEKRLDELHVSSTAIVSGADSAFAEFAHHYDAEVAKLTDEQRRLLHSHRQVMDQTRDLPSLTIQLEQAKSDVEVHLNRLIEMCDQVTQLLRSRTRVRQEKLSKFQMLVAPAQVQLSLLSLRQSDLLDSYSTKFRDGFSVFGTIQTQFAAASLHERIKKAYEELLRDLVDGYRLFFTHSEFSHYLTVFENDDLAITFDPTGTGQRPIDQLSAGQRCTAMFPILLKLRYGPLVIDQPEDNLDNRHIASIVSPAIATDKADRQMIMTSHNANLLVLSDPENVVVFEGQGNMGHIIAQGFLASRESAVTQHVLDILDGGERALELRYAKYGRARGG